MEVASPECRGQLQGLAELLSIYTPNKGPILPTTLYTRHIPVAASPHYLNQFATRFVLYRGKFLTTILTAQDVPPA